MNTHPSMVAVISATVASMAEHRRPAFFLQRLKPVSDSLHGLQW